MESNHKQKKKDKPDYARQSSTGSASSSMHIQIHDGVSAHSQALFVQKVRESYDAVGRGDFQTAIKAYSEAIDLEPTNHVLYTNRAAAYAKIQQFQKSLVDARKSRELNPKWAKDVQDPVIPTVLMYPQL
ncbi:hypothetical protein DPMN_000575 [Dreissena polymorpha]|uniref:Uncharacterized protein n=1 Tax=Dreissena polymorpha TaxID=45954 RepID=A0A9D4MI95_DREPO|nr:hypothetical protein DPMN_000575 [Dreissena polymorpha]